MDHREFLSQLSPEARITLTTPSNRAGLLHLAGHLLTIAGLAALVLSPLPGQILWQFGLGVALVFLFTLEHEATHFTPFRSPWLNRLAGHGAGLILILPFNWFRYFHMAHHRHTQIPGKDPELEGGKPDTWPAYLWHLTGLPVWSSQITTLLRHASGRVGADYLPHARHGLIRTEARTYLCVYATATGVSLWTGSTLILTLWIVPLLLGQPVLRLYLLAEHGRCAQVGDMFRNSRTTVTTRLVRALAWNMPYHAEHHAYPSVPFHKLPELHARTRPHLAELTDGYGTFHKSYAQTL